MGQDSSLEIKIPDLLYFKTTQAGTGDRIEGINHVRLKYVIEDAFGNILSAQSNVWINLMETIPGFLHGIQGMRIGEKRTLFIHPSLGYGALTTLTPCMELIAHTELYEVDYQSKITLPPLAAQNCDWLKCPEFQNKLEESIKLLPAYTGAFYHHLLSLITQEYP